jgi:hypothetical protein
MYYKDKLYLDLDYFILINLITFWPEINSPILFHLQWMISHQFGKSYQSPGVPEDSHD